MSENYVVFIEQPVKMDLLSIVTCRLRGKTMSEGIYWDGGQDTVLHLVSKHTGKVRSAATSSTLVVVVDFYLLPSQVSAVKYHTKALVTFHQINAFEEDGFLMVDLCCMDDGQTISNFLIQNLRKSGDALDQVAPPYFSWEPRKVAE